MNQTPAQVPTPDGKRTPLAALNTTVPATLEQGESGLRKRFATALKKLNLVLAGMYTGVGCSGTPHSHHSYREDTKTPPAKTR